MNVGMYLAFFKWCFLKMFSGSFNKAETFREELKKGTPDSIFASMAFIALSLLGFVVTALLAVWFIDDREIIRGIVFGYLFLAIFTYLYNAIKAAFECFLVDRQQIFDELKK